MHTIKTIFFLGFIAISIFSCQKKGCTDPVAENYEILKVADSIQKSSKNKKMVLMK